MVKPIMIEMEQDRLVAEIRPGRQWQGLRLNRRPWRGCACTAGSSGCGQAGAGRSANYIWRLPLDR